MIFPFPLGLRNFFKSPITLLIFIINLALFLFASSLGSPTEKVISDKYFIKVQGQLFSQYVLDHPENYLKRTQSMATLSLSGKKKQTTLMGRLALGDEAFLKEALSYNFSGDQIAINYWREKFTLMAGANHSYFSEILGLKSNNLTAYRFISYQFLHLSWPHFFGNMLFLLLFGILLEKIIGGLALFAVYLSSGVFAAIAFLYLSQASAIPLVGASGAISGLVALYSVIHWKKRVRFIYALFIPRLDYIGYIFLPGWVLSLMWLLADISGYIASLEEFGGVAHSAHIGGQIAGLLVGLTLFLIRWKREDLSVYDDLEAPTDGSWIVPASKFL